MTDIDLQPFCGTDETRPYIMKPFSFGEFSYATNGHIMVRIPRCTDIPEQTKKGNWEGPLAGIDEAAFTAPTFTLPEKPPADEECDDCDGRGTAHDCPECTCECKSCCGTGSQSAEGNISTEYKGTVIALRYVRKVLTLPGIEIADPRSKEHPILFRFNGGVGAVMPMRGTSVNHIDVFS